MTSIDIVKLAMEVGLLLVPAGPKVLRFVPPLIVSASEIEEAIAKLDQALSQL